MVAEQTRDDRRTETNEVFTPPELMKDMLADMDESIWDEGKTFCDPSCGNGNMLVYVLTEKIERGHIPLQALRTIYGVDYMEDNIHECKNRLVGLMPKSQQKDAMKIVNLQIVHHDALEWDFINWRPKSSGFKKLY